MNIELKNSEIPNNNNTTSGLNDNQKKAVSHGNGPLLIVAGAGSGKTRVLTHRIAKLIEKSVSPENILAVTFTNKAAKEMQHRVRELVSGENIKPIWIGTFHSVCGRILRHDINKLELPEGEKWTRNFVIYDESDSVSLVKKCIKALDMDHKVYAPKNIKSFISALKVQGHDAFTFSKTATNHREVKISEIFDLYQKELSKNNALDFDDLLLYTVRLLENNDQIRSYYHRRFRHILVDEFQDTNLLQYEIIRLITEGVTKSQRKDLDRKELWSNRGITVVGDVDQSIYSWRGADYKIILGFKNDFPENTVIKLEENYRSTETILNVADSIIKNNKERIEKVLIPTINGGEKVVCFEADDEHEEAHYIAKEAQRLLSKGYKYSDMGILYRTNAQSRAIEESLIKKNIPYNIVGGFRFYDRKEIKDLIAYLKVIYNPSDSVSLKRIINVPKRALGATTIAKIEDHATKNGFTLYKTLLEVNDVQALSQKTVNSVKAFVDLMEECRQACKSLPVSDLIEFVLKKSGYWDELEREGTLDSEERQVNVQELFSVAKDFEAEFEGTDDESGYGELGEFLARVSLYSDLDNLKQSTNNMTMMTLHLAKGLEYPIVFLAGLEEGIFPHIKAIDSLDDSEMEEERRLMYVGVTRAKELLYFTYAAERKIFGQSEYAEVSRFIGESPKKLLNGYFGGLDEKDNKNRMHVSKKGIKRKFSEYEKSEQIVGKNVTVVRSFQTKPKPKESATKIKLEIGDKVKHEKFGTGVVEKVLSSGSKYLVNIDFEGVGKKLLDPVYAKIIKVD